MRSIEVQVWTGHPTELLQSHWQALLALLDASERTSLAAFHHESDRQAYLLAHGLRRLALAQELNFEPRDLVFSHDAGGQPHLAWPRVESVFFSHSHCRGAVAFAVSRCGPVGIDVEADYSPHAADDLLASFLVADSEAAASLSFARKWTALEAYWKATGKGLMQTNPRIVCIPRFGAGNSTASADSVAPASEWTVHLEGEPLSPARGCVLAIDGSNTSGVHVISLAMTDAALQCRTQIQVRSVLGLLGHQTTPPALPANDRSAGALTGENAPDFTCDKRYLSGSNAHIVTH